MIQYKREGVDKQMVGHPGCNAEWFQAINNYFEKFDGRIPNINRQISMVLKTPHQSNGKFSRQYQSV